MLNTKNDSVDISTLKNIFKMLSEETRIRIISLLEFVELKVGEIQTILNIKQSTLSAHLNLLKDFQLVSSRKEGKNVFYLTTPLKKFKQEKNILKKTLEIAQTSKWYLSDQKKLNNILEVRKRKTIKYFDNDFNTLKNPTPSYQVWAQGFLCLIKNKKIIDLGCGDGQLISSFFHLDRNNIVYGLDNSIKQVRLAQNRFKKINIKNKNLKIIFGDMEKTEFPKDFFDLVIISHALHHVATPRLVIQEIFRILKDDGELLIFDLNQHDNIEIIKKFGDFWMGFDKKILKNLLQLEGFEIISYQTIKESNFKKIQPIIVLGKKLK